VENLSADLYTLHQKIADHLAMLGAQSPYTADANEPDPRYLGYGVRAPEMKRVISGLRAEFAPLDSVQKVELAKHLIGSGYGEQKTVALALLEGIADHFSPARFDELEDLIRGLHGWSKIDSYTGLFLKDILEAHEAEFLRRLKAWNTDEDLWLRRASVVIFTRKVAKSGKFKDLALSHCGGLVHDPEHLVQTGVGWCLRDLMRWHKDEILDYMIDLRKQGVSSKITLYALRDIKGDERAAILG